MKYYHRNYFFLLTASALTTVLWALTYTCLLYTSPEALVPGAAAYPSVMDNPPLGIHLILITLS